MALSLSEETLTQALAVAVEAARAAGALMDECFERRRAMDGDFKLDVETKSGAADMVTQYDKQCEDIVIGIVSKFSAAVIAADGTASEPRPFDILSEESRPDQPLTAAPTWVVDPIDGTTGFVHNSFDCGVSVGLTLNRVPVLGVVLLPRMKELFTAVKGRGAFCNDQRIAVSGCTDPRRALVCTHCPYKRTPECLGAVSDINMELARDIQVHAVRSYGSAAMDMCSVACGRLDLYFECGIQSWDMAAAAVIVAEAGGVVKDIAGGELNLLARAMSCGSSAAMADLGVDLSVKHKYREMMFPGFVLPE